MSRRELLYAAPWAEPLVRRPDRPTELVEYGPSAASYSRQVARHRDWSWRPHTRRPTLAARELVRAYMRGADGKLREGIPERELEVYLAVVEQGHSTRWAARALGLARPSVQTYLRRLRERAKRWLASHDDCKPRPTRAAHLLARHASSAGRVWCHVRVVVPS